MKNKKIKTLSLLFSGFAFGEANKIYTFFTKEYGLIKAIGYGTRKHKNRYSGLFELCNVLELVLTTPKKGELYIISDCVLIKSHHKIREASEVLAHIYNVVEAMSNMIKMSTENDEIFDLMLLTLENFCKNQNNVFALSRAFLIKVLKIQGFLPDLNFCTKCHKKIDNEMYITEKIGWFLCSFCKNLSSKRLSEKSYDYLIETTSTSINNLSLWQFSKFEKSELKRLVNMIIYSVINKQLITEKII
jgi:DNA repair protein RecO (recombination protein O)